MYSHPDLAHLYRRPRVGRERIASLAVDLAAGSAPDSFRVLPAGLFRASDGRPSGLDGWIMDGESMAMLVADAQTRATDYPIDYEHQILESRKNGQPAPAAGWFHQIEARADGLYATDVRWTERARQMIEAGEYRYISPVFAYDPSSGRVTRLVMAALTNHPALDGLTDLAPLTEDFSMSDFSSELRERILYFLNLPLTATDAEILAELDKLKAMIASADQAAAQARAEVEALKSKSVPMDELAAMQAELAALKADAETKERRALIEAGLADGRILPAQKDFWSAQPLSALTAWMSVAQPITALTQVQRVAANAGKPALSEADREACRLLNMSEETFAAAKARIHTTE